jgi:hypothetical protein
MINISDVLKELRGERPVFHSEADFQHALALTIHKKYSGLNIRLEKPLNNEKNHLDIFAFKDNKTVAIEVKYKTKNLHTAEKNEEFNLKNHNAQDQGRYDFLKDISRLENVLEKKSDGAGFAVFLTNDYLYWEKPKKKDPVDEAFRIHEGKTIKGKLSWKEGTSKKTMKTREEPIIVNGKYTLNWKEYSNLQKQNGKFRYLVIEVKHGNGV